MARGSRITNAKRAQFRSKYLELGNASAAARATKIAESTGRDLAREAEADPAFVEARRDLFARVLPEGVALMMGMVRTVQARVLERDLSPDQLARLARKHNLKSFSYQNPKPQYAKVVVDAVGKLLQQHKQTQPVEGPGGTGPAVVIELAPLEPDAEEAGAAPNASSMPSADAKSVRR